MIDVDYYNSVTTTLENALFGEDSAAFCFLRLDVLRAVRILERCVRGSSSDIEHDSATQLEEDCRYIDRYVRDAQAKIADLLAFIKKVEDSDTLDLFSFDHDKFKAVRDYVSKIKVAVDAV